MSTYIVTIRPCQPPQIIPFEEPSYQLLKKHLDNATLECVRIVPETKRSPGLDMWIDDDGRNKKLPINFPVGLVHSGDIVGPAVFAGSKGPITIGLALAACEYLVEEINKMDRPTEEVQGAPPHFEFFSI